MNITELNIQKVNNISELNSIEESRGNLIILGDSKVYYDIDSEHRDEISSECVFLKTEDDKSTIEDKSINKLYIVLDTLKVYRSDGTFYFIVDNTKGVESTVNSIVELYPTIIVDGENMTAPATLSTQVILDDGSTLDAAFDDEVHLLTVTRTKHTYLNTEYDGQKIFDVDYPKENYNFIDGDLMAVVIGNKLIDTTRYSVTDSGIIFDDTVTLYKGDVVLVIFTYSMDYDVNLGVVLGTNNIADRSITSQKISEDFTISADKVNETLSRIFFTREYEDKLKGIEYNATCYHHPETHPASMIVQDEEHRFLTDEQIEYYNNKANADDVYTKIETDDRIKQLIGSAPEELDTLKEIADALNNDPDFAGTMVKELAKKAGTDVTDKLAEDLAKKVDKTDYIRATIYGTPSKSYDKVGDITQYTLSVEDKELQDYADGMAITIKIAHTNETKSVLRINSLDYKPILTQDGYELVPGELTEGSIYTLRYNATQGNFILQGKGGVKINDTTQPIYTIASGETIERGDLIDLVDNTIYKSVPKARIISRNYTTQSKFISNGKTQIFGVSNSEFVLFWRKDAGLYVQKFMIKDGYVNINSQTGTYMVPNGSCIDYDIAQITPRQFLMTTSDNRQMFTAMLINIDADDFIFGTPYTRQEQEDITNVKAFSLGNSRAIIAWQAGSNTRTMYMTCGDTDLSTISLRDNIDYPLDYACQVGNDQILFAKPLTDNRIRKWVMNITSNDFYNSTLTYITNEDANEKYKNLAMTYIGDNKVMLNATNKDNTILYTIEINVDPDRGAEVLNTYTQTYTANQMKTHIIPKYIRLREDRNEYVSVSLYNHNAPTIGDSNLGPNCMKIATNRFNEGVQMLDMLSEINEIDNNYSFTILKNKMIGIVFNYFPEGSADSQLAFILANVSLLPDAVALQPGSSGDSIKIMDWNL